jgi:hypothetical protein
LSIAAQVWDSELLKNQIFPQNGEGQ